MIKLYYLILTLVFSMTLLFPMSCYPLEHKQAFSIPETLKFRLIYAGVKVGESSLTIQAIDEHIVITSSADSSGFISMFFTVKDRVKSTLTIDEYGRMIPLSYKINLREGGYRRDKEVTFQLSEGRVIYQDFIKETKEYLETSPDVVDPLTSIYLIRERELVIGKTELIKIYDSKKFWDVEVLILRKETIKTPAGVFDTIVVRPLMKSEGIFKRSGPMNIYLTDDTKKIPVKLVTKISLGNVIAELIEVK